MLDATVTHIEAGRASAPAIDAADTACYHCGLPMPASDSASADWTVRIDNIDHAMCCPGCAAVAQTIVDLGQQSYYRDRSAFAATAEGAQLLPPQLQLYDNADPRFALDDESRETTLAVEGIRCAACVWLIENRLARLPGVPGLPCYLEQQGFCADGRHGFCAAHGAVLDRYCGRGWLAVGDAALSFDPLSAQGLFNALFTGLAGAEAAQRHLQGDQQALPGYQDQLHAIERAYASHLDASYRQEQRWPQRLFWQRRQARLCATQ